RPWQPRQSGQSQRQDCALDVRRRRADEEPRRAAASVRGNMPATFDNYIAGQWVRGSNTAANRNPSDLPDVIGDYAMADADQTRAAIAAAKNAFAEWSISPIQRRADLLDAVGSEILARKDEIGRLLAREEGKTLAEAVGEATRAGHIFKFFAGEAVRLSGEKLPSVRPRGGVEITRQPVGGVGL